ncbi:MAG: ABC transporter permease subunit [Verrucomicrobiota bacterium]
MSRGGEGEEEVIDNYWYAAWRQGRGILWCFVTKHWVALILALLVIIMLALVSIWIGREGYFSQAVHVSPELAFAAPEARGPVWGADELGTDWLARVIVGAFGSMLVALTGWLVIFIAGGGIGILMMQLPRPVRALAGLKSALLVGIPGFLLVSVLAVGFGGGPWGVMLAMGAVGTLFIGLMVADALLQVEDEPHYRAAVACGVPRSQLWPEVLLSRAALVALAGSLAAIPALLLVESAFSFVSGGGEGDDLWTLGTLMGEVQPYIVDAPWLMFYPGVVLMGMCFIWRLLGDLVRYRLKQSTKILATEWRWF